MTTTAVVEGTFGRVTMDDLLGVVAMSRQCLELVLPEAGTMTVKSGQVLVARAGQSERGAAAFFALYGRPGTQYAVYQRESPVEGAVTPIGSITSLVERARRQPEPGSTVLAGSFDNFSFADLLGAVSTSRQGLLVTLIRGDGSRARLTVKSGLILACDDPGPAGPRADRDALHSVLRDPGRQFVVNRLSPTPNLSPIARLADLLAAAAKQGRRQVLMEGRLAEFPLPDVLTTLALSRQVVELTTSDAAGVVGQLVLKAGQVLDARCRSHPESGREAGSGREAFAAWVNSPGDTFSVTRGRMAPGTRPLAALADWMAQVRVGAPPKPLLDGRLADFPLPDVFAVLSASRQCLALELVANGKQRGRIVLKSGSVLEARSSEPLDGRAALNALLATPGDRFAVTRTELPPGATPIGRLADLQRGPTPSVQQLQPQPPAQAQPRTPEPVVVIEGRFADSSLPELLSVLAVSRSCLELRIPRRKSVATLVVKAGQLVSALVDGESDPVRVLAALLADPGETFTVLRIPTPSGARTHGSLEDLVADAQHLSEDLATVVGFPHGGPVTEPPPSRPSVSVAVVTPTPPPAPTRDPRLDQLAVRLDSLQALIAANSGPGPLQEAAALLGTLERRIADQDRAIEASARGARTDRLLVLLVLMVQLVTAAAVVVVSLWSMSWSR